MESSDHSNFDASTVAQRLETLCNLGKDGGLGGERLWWLLYGENTKAKKNHPDAIAIYEQLNTTTASMKKEWGHNWRSKFEDPISIGKHFYVHQWKGCNFVTICNDMIKRHSQEANAIRNSIFSNLQRRSSNVSIGITPNTNEINIEMTSNSPHQEPLHPPPAFSTSSLDHSASSVHSTKGKDPRTHVIQQKKRHFSQHLLTILTPIYLQPKTDESGG